MHSISDDFKVSLRHAMADPAPELNDNDNDNDNEIHRSNVKIITNKNPLKTYEQFQQEQEELNHRMDEYQKALSSMISPENYENVEENAQNISVENVEESVENIENNLDYIKEVVYGHHEIIQQIQVKIDELKSFHVDRTDKIIQLESNFIDYKKITDERVEKLAKLFLSISI